MPIAAINQLKSVGMLFLDYDEDSEWDHETTLHTMVTKEWDGEVYIRIHGYKSTDIMCDANICFIVTGYLETENGPYIMME